MITPASHESGAAPEGGYEKRDVSLLQIAVYTILAIALLIMVVIFVMDYFVGTREELVEEMVLSPTSPELRELRAREADALGTYRLLDSAAGQYQIPIERAMQLVAEEAYRTRTESGGGP